MLSWGYGAGARVRGWTYDAGLRRRRRLPVPVICVGNLTAGGTGKTPFVAWLAARWLREGRRPGILARGYGGPARPGGALNDEGLVLRHALGDGVPQVQGADRFRAGERLLATHPDVDVVLLDDGFQHRRLARDLDVVLLDATRPPLHDAYLPRGRLREAPAALARAGAVVLTRAGDVADLDRERLVAEVRRHTEAPIAFCEARPVSLEAAGETLAPDALRDRRVHAACGIGHPEAFRRTLERLGARVDALRALPDHGRLGPGEWEALREGARRAGADWLVVTRKDAVKWDRVPEGVAVLDVEAHVLEGEDALWERVKAAAAGR